MAELMNLPPNWDGIVGPCPIQKWGVVYRDEREPALPEYVCLLWETRREPGVIGRCIRLNTATFLSFVSADATQEEAVERARKLAGRPDHGVKPEDVYFWGVVRK